MAEQFGANDLPNPNGCSESSDDYLERAARACEAGDLVLGMHLYLAAYEQAVANPDIPDGMALSGLHEAWHIACSLKERSMAEYVYEKLEPFLTTEEIPEYAHELQDLALDRLEQYGFSREDLADMAEMISQDLLGSRASIVKVESLSLPQVDGGESLADLAVDHDEADVQPDADIPYDAALADEDVEGERPVEPFIPASSEPEEKRPEHVGLGVADVNEFNPYDLYNTSSVGASYHAATNDGSGAYVFSRDETRIAESEQAHSESQRAAADESLADREPVDASRQSEDEGASDGPADRSEHVGAQKALASKGESSNLATSDSDPAPSTPEKAGSRDTATTPAAAQGGNVTFNYRQLVGYEEAVSIMRDFGVGLHRDKSFQNFIAMMNARHGLSRMPSPDTMLFRAPVIEDAARFLEATIGEIGFPVLRMSMEENIQGMPLLCVSVQGNSRPRMNHTHNRFEGPGILVIEDLDMWALPTPPEGMEGFGNFMMANISRGAREAVGLIESAVADPDVFVLATATTQGDVDPFFYDLLEPLTVVDISNPNEAERDGVWAEIMNDHPSMRLLSRANLTRLSAGLSRYDIYVAAREAIEEAYKAGLVQRSFVPVVEQNIFDKLAACQPLESDEYRAIEDEIVRAFRSDLESLDDFIDGSRG